MKFMSQSIDSTNYQSILIECHSNLKKYMLYALYNVDVNTFQESNLLKIGGRNGNQKLLCGFGGMSNML